jgi:hypothetical protein
MAETDDRKTLERIRRAAEGGSTRSPLYLWMWRNHDAFTDIVGLTRPNWKRLADEFTALGFSNESSGELTAAVVRQTWVRVRKRYAQHHAGKKPRSKASSTALPAVAREIGAGTGRPASAPFKPSRLAGSDGPPHPPIDLDKPFNRS